MTCDLLSDLLSPNIPQPIALYIRDAQRGQSSEVEAEARTLRSRPRPNLKRPNRTLYFTVKIYAEKHCAIVNAISAIITLHAF